MLLWGGVCVQLPDCSPLPQALLCLTVLHLPCFRS